MKTPRYLEAWAYNEGVCWRALERELFNVLIGMILELLYTAFCLFIYCTMIQMLYPSLITLSPIRNNFHS
jgi:hypothetical protein